MIEGDAAEYAADPSHAGSADVLCVDLYDHDAASPVLDSEDFVVFELRGALLALFPVEKLGADAHAEPEIGQGGIRFNIIITVDAPDEVDALAETVRRAGGRFTKPPTDAEFFVGRDAYFADPEGNYWEIACAPPDNPVVAASRRAAGVGQ